MKATALTIFVTPVKGEEIRIEKTCTLKQAVTLAKKEARKLINAGGMFVMINIIGLDAYGLTETLAHIEAEKEGRRVKFSDETPAETYAVCWGDEYKEEYGENNAIAETANEIEAKEIAESESEANNSTMSVIRKSDNKVMAIYNNQPEPTNPDNTPTTMSANETNELGYNAATRAAMIDAARAFLLLADKLNEEVSAYIDGSNKLEAEAAYIAVKEAEAVFLKYYCAYWGEPRRRPCLGYELAESSLPEDDEYFNGAA